jgi:hypothetical protein
MCLFCILALALALAWEGGLEGVGHSPSLRRRSSSAVLIRSIIYIYIYICIYIKKSNKKTEGLADADGLDTC